MPLLRQWRDIGAQAKPSWGCPVGHVIGNEAPIQLHLPVSNPGQLAIR